MGWLDRIFGKKEKQTELPLILSFNDIDSFILSKSQELLLPFTDSSKKIYDDIQLELIQFQNNLKLLEKALPKQEKVDPVLLQKAVSNRNALINKLNDIVDALKQNIEFDYHSIIQFYNQSYSTLTLASNRAIQNYEPTETVFNEATDVLKSMKSIDKLLKSLGHLINDNQSQITSIESTLSTIGNIKQNSASIESEKSKHNQVKSRLSGLNEKAKSLVLSIENLLKSEEWSKYNDLIKQKERLEYEIGNVVTEVVQKISPLERALKKFKNQATDKHQINILDEYINSPFDGLMADKEKQLIPVLKSVEKMILEDKIDVKVEEKVLAKIKEITEEKVLDRLLDLNNTLSSQKQAVEQQLNEMKMDEKKKLLQRDLEKTQEEIKATEEEINQMSNKIEKLLTDSEALKQNLIKNTEEILGKKVEVNF